MTEFERPISSSRRLFRTRFSAARAAEAVFGGLAKGTLWVVGVAVLVLVVLSGGQGLADLPTTRRGWRNLLQIILSVLVVVGIVIAFAALNDKYLHWT